MEHHEGQTSVTFQWMAFMVIENRLLLPILQAPVARDLTIVFVGLPIAIFPLMVLAGGKPQPVEQPFGR